MTEEKIKAKAKEQFPNDEFKQQAVINAINWATKELQEQIEKMKCCGNCKFQEIEDYTGCPICNVSDCNFNSKWEIKEK